MNADHMVEEQTAWAERIAQMLEEGPMTPERVRVALKLAFNKGYSAGVGYAQSLLEVA